jgi:hypothetical protein
MMSAHDEQLANLWQFLEPVNFLQDDQKGNYSEWYFIPYASHMHMELHKKKECEHHCYYLLFTSNGQPLKFKGLNPIGQENIDLKSP